MTRSDDAPDPDEFRIPTVEELESMRLAHGLTQYELSRRAGLEEKRFNDILRLGIDPHVSTIRAFVEALQEIDPQTTEDNASNPGPNPAQSSLLGRIQGLDDDHPLKQDPRQPPEAGESQ